MFGKPANQMAANVFSQLLVVLAGEEAHGFHNDSVYAAAVATMLQGLPVVRLTIGRVCESFGVGERRQLRFLRREASFRYWLRCS